MKLYVFDDAIADGWHPFSLTRPSGELLFGAFSLRERLERWASLPASGYLTRAWLASYAEAGTPPALRRGSELGAGARLLLSSRFVAGEGCLPPLQGDVPTLLRAGGEVAGVALPEGHPDPSEAWLLEPSGFPGPEGAELEVGGEMLSAVWQLVARNPARLRDDLESLRDEGAPLSPGAAHVLGDGRVHVGRDVRIEPGVLFDTREGDVRLEDRVEVRYGSRLEGPLWVGTDSRILGGSLASTSAGPFCVLRGEVQSTVILGYSNKAHDGFLGHAYVGRWVNLGALTTNSDLKNTYGTVRLQGPKGEIDTGLLKLGCLIGDHVKTAIGTLIGTGTIIGAGAQVFGETRLPRWVAPFRWGGAPEGAVYDRTRFLEVAGRVMRRRGIECDERVRAWLGACWDAGTGEEG